MAKWPFEGKIALVCGGSRGIGRAVVAKLAALGADVAINYGHDDEQAARVAGEVRGAGRRAWTIKADAGNVDAIQAMFRRLREDAGGLDILVNCVARGLQRPRPAMTSRPNHLRQTFDVNVLGPWFSTQAAAPLMEERGGGVVVNLTSLGAQRYLPNYAAVAVTKGALDTLTRYLAVELAPKGIRVNGVCPSWVDETGGVRALPGEFGDVLGRASPAGRAVRPEDVANVVAFLCSPEAAMIVGQNIVVDGGLTLLGLVR